MEYRSKYKAEEIEAILDAKNNTGEGVDSNLDEMFSGQLQTKEVEVSADTTIKADEGFLGLKEVSVKVNGGGGSASGNDYQYIDLSKITNNKFSVVRLSIMAKVDTGDGYNIGPSGSLLEFENMSNAVNATKAVAISPSMKLVSYGEEITVEQVSQMLGVDLSPALITEEEFYAL